MFNNATTNIPDMYGAGFMSTFVTRRLMQFGMMNNYQFSGQSPERHYQVLAAKRMATLISEIRAVKPDETVTVMAHSQGTVISLLAQAMLHDAGKRCADCLILVDSPYALTEAYLANTASQHGAPLQTVQARLQTLVNIVSQCTKTPHTLPALKDLVFSSPGSGGVRVINGRRRAARALTRTENPQSSTSVTIAAGSISIGIRTIKLSTSRRFGA